MNINTSKEARKALRAAIKAKVEALKLSNNDAAPKLGLSIAQTSRLINDHDAFSTDRLIDAARAIRIPVRLSA